MVAKLNHSRILKNNQYSGGCKLSASVKAGEKTGLSSFPDKRRQLHLLPFLMFIKHSQRFNVFILMAHLQFVFLQV
jgi:hypothetical protein